MSRSHAAGFTMMELVIVCAIMAIISAPLISVYLLPFRYHSLLADTVKTAQERRELLSHLARDIRCADSITEDASGTLRISVGDESIEYRSGPREVVRVLQTTGAPLEFHFENLSCTFHAGNGARYLTLSTEVTSHLRLTKVETPRKTRVVFCSNLEAGP